MNDSRSSAALLLCLTLVALLASPIPASPQTRGPSALAATRPAPVASRSVVPTAAAHPLPPVGNATSVDSGAELSMMGLQSNVSRRQTQVQATTNMLGSMHDGMRQVVGNIGGGGEGKPPCPGGCVKATRER